MDPLGQFDGQNYLSLETYRKNGTAVATPVWFAEREAGVYCIYSEAEAGKVKRVRNNPRVRIAPCTARGRVTGDWVEGEARILADAAEIARAHQLLTRKYFLKRFGDLFNRLGGKPRAELEIRVTPSGR